jgi:tRNA-modifying protein YgfZ
MTDVNKMWARRRREYVGVRGSDAEDYLQRMVSNDVAALAPGETCEALLLTPKARVIAPLVVVRRGADDFLLLTEPGLGERLAEELLRFRFAAKAEIAVEEHENVVCLAAGSPAGAIAVPTADYGMPAFELVDASPPPDAEELSAAELEVLRIRAGTPRWGKEVDDRVLPAEAGLVERAVSLTKGCYPGQEPIARLQYRGHANRGLRVLVLDAEAVPEPETEIRHGEKVVGRVTSAARDNGRVLALGYVRVEVPADAVLQVGDALARPLD